MIKKALIFGVNGRMPRQFNELMSFCKEKGIEIIEDAAQSLGSLHNGIQIGIYIS